MSTAGAAQQGGNSSSSPAVVAPWVLQECPLSPKVFTKRETNHLITGVPNFKERKIKVRIGFRAFGLEFYTAEDPSYVQIFEHCGLFRNEATCELGSFPFILEIKQFYRLLKSYAFLPSCSAVTLRGPENINMVS